MIKRRPKNTGRSAAKPRMQSKAKGAARTRGKSGANTVGKSAPPLRVDEYWALSLVGAAPDLVCLCREGRIDYINAAGARLLGFPSKKKALGRPFADFIHSDYSEITADLLESIVDEGRPSIPLKFSSLKGRKIDAEVLVIPTGKPAERAYIVQAHDITNRVRATEAMKRSETRYRNLVEKSLDLICVCKAGEITFLNDAGAKILGVKNPSRLIGRRFADLVHPDYRDIVAEGLENMADEGSVPLKLVRSDRKTIDVEVGVIPLGGPNEASFMLEARDITEQVRAAQSLREREQRLRGILDTVADAIITIDQKCLIQSFNPTAESIFGYPAREIIGENVSILIPDPHHGKHDGYIRKYLRTGVRKIIGKSNREQEGRRKDGTVFPIDISVTEMRHGKQRLFTGIVRDITERKRAEEELRRAHDELETRVEERTRELTEEIGVRRRAEERLSLAGKVIDNLSEAVVIVDKDFRVTSVNPAFSEITGYSSKKVLGQLPSFYIAVKKDNDLFAKMWRSIKRKGHWEGEFWNYRKGGEEYAERMSVSAITDKRGEVNQYAAVISDITKRKQDEERIHYQANFDALTGLPNRAMFHDRLDHALPTMERAKKKLALMFIDLDGFKLVNDTLGHDIGDLLLKEASERLIGCVRNGDTVARLGGDEFTVIMPNLDDPRNAPLVAQRVLDALAKPFILKGHEAFVSASIGITVFPDDTEEAGELLKYADAAMYSAKEQGKANYQFFTSDLNKEIKERLILKNGLSRALERQDFRLHYQPKLDIKSGNIMGVEALIRWNSPELGPVSPVKFIPILEETGGVVEAGEWAIRMACRQHKDWLEAGLKHVRIAVNLSARQIREPSFVPNVEKVLAEIGIEPSGLEIEITESMLMSDTAKAVIALNELHEMGIHVAMDDFGTGYSSLSYLKRFPIDTIKIDRSFVSDITTSPDDAEIIRTIIIMGKTLNMRVVAEGVETEEQLAMLKRYECDEIQGYFFSRPMPADKLTLFLKQRSAPSGRSGRSAKAAAGGE